MAGGLESSNENLSLFREQIDKSLVSIDRLGSALKGLANFLPIQEIIKIQDGFSNLNRTLALNSTEITKLNKSLETLTNNTRQYAKTELANMITIIAKSNAAISTNIQTIEKLTSTFSNAYKQGAPQFLQIYVKMNETLPQLQSRTLALSTSVTTLNEVFKVGGKEGLSAYLASIGKISEQTLKTEDTISSSFKRLEKTFTDFKTKIGESQSGALKNILDVGGGSDLGMLGLGAGSLLLTKYLGSRALGGVGKALGLGGGTGANTISMNPPYTPQTAAYGGMPNPFGGAAQKAGGFVRNNAGLLGGAAYLYGSANQDSGLGRGASVAGAFGVGYSIGGQGLTGVAVGTASAVGESGRSIYGAYQDHKAMIAKARQEGLDQIQAVKMRGAELENGGWDAIQRRRNRGKASEGSFEDYSNLANDAIEDAGIKHHVSTLFNDQKGVADAALLRQTGLGFSNRSYGIANAKFGSENSILNSNLDTNPFKASSASSLFALDDRSKAINSRLGALTAGGANDNPEAVAQLQAELASLNREKFGVKTAGSSAKASFFGNQAGLAGAQAQNTLQNGGSLSDYNKSVEDQKKAVELSIDELKNVRDIAVEMGRKKDVLKADTDIQAAKNQLVQIELDKSSKTLQIMQNAFSLKQKGLSLGSLKGAGSELVSLNAESDFVKQQLADDASGKIKLTYEQKLGLQQKQKELGLQTNYQSKVAVPIANAQASAQIAEIQANSSGAMGAQEQVALAEKRLEILKQIVKLETENTENNDTNAKAVAEANQKGAALQLLKLKTFGQEKQNIDFEKDMNSKKLQVAQLSGNPFLASKLYKEQMELSQSELARLNKELEFARTKEGKSENSAEVQGIKSKIATEQVNIAQQLNFQRRSFAEQFTQQTLNMPNGSYLFPGATSEFQNVGSAYYEGISQNGPKNKNRTYQSQISSIFGEGTSERSSYEQLAGSLIDGLTASDTVLNVRLVNDAGLNPKHSGTIP